MKLLYFTLRAGTSVCKRPSHGAGNRKKSVSNFTGKAQDISCIMFYPERSEGMRERPQESNIQIKVSIPD